MSDLVGNPEDRFSRDAAHIVATDYSGLKFYSPANERFCLFDLQHDIPVNNYAGHVRLSPPFNMTST